LTFVKDFVFSSYYKSEYSVNYSLIFQKIQDQIKKACYCCKSKNGAILYNFSLISRSVLNYTYNVFYVSHTKVFKLYFFV